MLAWIEPNEPLLPPHRALQEPNGLLCAGRDLSAQRLIEAYSQGTFPWYSEGQPVLWWCPHPRMVLKLTEFRKHRSLEKIIRRELVEFHESEKLDAEKTGWQIRVNTSFEKVMRCCAAPRSEEGGTWISEEILQAYCALHQQGFAHSVEVWRVEPTHQSLIGGLYGVCLGQMFYGESMFTREANASKTALTWLVKFLQSKGTRMIDCQQNTQHLAFMGAAEVPREVFLHEIKELIHQPSIKFPKGLVPWISI